MSIAQRIYKKLDNGTESEKELVNGMLHMISENPTKNLDRLHSFLWCVADLYKEADEKELLSDDKASIYDYIQLIGELYDEMGIESPLARNKRLEAESKRKENFPPLRLVQ